MKILSIAILRYNDGADPTILAQAFEVSSFGYFQRSGVREMITFFTKTFVKRTQKGQRQTIQHEEYNCHVYVRADGLAGIVVADMEYPPRVAFATVSTLMNEYEQQTSGRWKTQNAGTEWDRLQKAVVEYQDPAKADKIAAIHKELEETTAILHKTIDNVLDRGEKLDELVNKSQDLSTQSKMFYKEARKTNSCCIIM